MEMPTWLVWLVSIVLLLNVVGLLLVANQDVEAVVDFTEQNARLDSLESGVQGLSDSLAEEDNVSESSEVEQGAYSLSKSEFEDEALEAEASRLATEDVESRDFRKAAFDVLVDFNVSVDSYRDITVDIRNTDVDENEVEFSVKLNYFLDEDEDETERARLVDFTVVVDDLDFDDDFEDGEVDDTYLDTLEVLRVYD